jgi:hypothetical protein
VHFQEPTLSSESTPPAASYILTRWLFLRVLGLIYLTAFVSLWAQLDGLVGSNGILPAEPWMRVLREQFPGHYLELPTLAWLSAGDGFLHGLCAAGVLASLLVIFGVAPAPALFLLWLVYLSLMIVCRQFLAFQWDTLLLETGFLAIFFAPWQAISGPSREPPPPAVALWLFRWLLFRLMFQSGAVKLLWADPTWWTLAALDFHYETQPLPTWIGFFAHQLPGWFQRLSVFVMFAIELGMPYLIFARRLPRLIAFGALVGLQVVIALTGNYCFFNWLSITLCLLLLDDAALRRLVPRRWRDRLPAPRVRDGQPMVQRVAVAAFALVVAVVTACQMINLVLECQPQPAGEERWLARPVDAVLRRSDPFRTINSYGLFRVMTTQRLEIVVEGSDDGTSWQAYEFKYKPGDPARRPRFVAPHQPRLDWQMWFAALDHYASPNNRWFLTLLTRLLEGSPQVVSLLDSNPFPDEPPHNIRATLYEYHFTDWSTWREEGTWWRRERLGLYCPIVSRDDLRLREGLEQE